MHTCECCGEKRHDVDWRADPWIAYLTNNVFDILICNDCDATILENAIAYEKELDSDGTI